MQVQSRGEFEKLYKAQQALIETDKHQKSAYRTPIYRNPETNKFYYPQCAISEQPTPLKRPTIKTSEIPLKFNSKDSTFWDPVTAEIYIEFISEEAFDLARMTEEKKKRMMELKAEERGKRVKRLPKLVIPEEVLKQGRQQYVCECPKPVKEEKMGLGFEILEDGGIATITRNQAPARETFMPMEMGEPETTTRIEPKVPLFEAARPMEMTVEPQKLLVGVTFGVTNYNLSRDSKIFPYQNFWNKISWVTIRPKMDSH